MGKIICLLRSPQLITQKYLFASKMIQKIYKDRENLLSISFLVIMNLVVFSRLFDNFFIKDDFAFLKIATTFSWNPRDIIFSYPHFNFIRPLLTMSFAVLYELVGTEPAGYYMANVILHTLNSVLVFLLTRFLTKNSTIGFLAALIFALNSAHVETVLWLSCMSELECTFFYMFSALLFFLFLRQRSMFYYATSLFSFFLTLLSKETGISLVIILILYYYIYKKELNVDTKKIALYLLPFIFLSLGYLFVQYSIRYSSYILTPPVQTDWNLGIHSIPNFVYTIFVLPLGSVTKEFLLNAGIGRGHLKVIFQVLVLVLAPLLFYGIVCLFKSKNLALKFSFIWILVTFLPTSFFLDYPESRWLYNPSVGFSILFAILFYNLFSLKLRKTSIFILSILFFLIILVNFVQIHRIELLYQQHGFKLKSIISDLRYYGKNFPDNSVIFFVGLPHELYPTDMPSLLYIYFGKNNFNYFRVEERGKTNIQAFINSKLSSLKKVSQAFVFQYHNSHLRLVTTDYIRKE